MFVKFCCLLSTVYCLLFFIGCKEKGIKAPAEKTINVQIQSAVKKSLRPFIEAIGTLNPYEEVIISAEIDGVVKDIRIDEGTAVSRRTLIASIDDVDYSLEAKNAEAALKQAEANLSNTSMEFKRKETLYKEGLVTRQQFDDVSTRLLLVEAEVERAKAAVSLAEQKLSKTRIYSPLSGVVKEKKVEMGNYVKNGTPLFTIIQTNPLKLNFTVSEKDVGKLKSGQDVIFKVDAFPDKEFKGKVNIVYPSLDENTRTLQVEAVVQNPNSLLKPGLFAHVKLYTGRERETTVVLSIALLYEGEATKVFVIEGNIAKERIVKIGQKHKEMVEIIEGVKEGEQVVIVGQQNLSDGVRVNVAR